MAEEVIKKNAAKIKPRYGLHLLFSIKSLLRSFDTFFSLGVAIVGVLAVAIPFFLPGFVMLPWIAVAVATPVILVGLVRGLLLAANDIRGGVKKEKEQIAELLQAEEELKSKKDKLEQYQGCDNLNKLLALLRKMPIKELENLNEKLPAASIWKNRLLSVGKEENAGILLTQIHIRNSPESGHKHSLKKGSMLEKVAKYEGESISTMLLVLSVTTSIATTISSIALVASVSFFIPLTPVIAAVAFFGSMLVGAALGVGFAFALWRLKKTERNRMERACERTNEILDIDSALATRNVLEEGSGLIIQQIEASQPVVEEAPQEFRRAQISQTASRGFGFLAQQRIKLKVDAAAEEELEEQEVAENVAEEDDVDEFTSEKQLLLLSGRPNSMCAG